MKVVLFCGGFGTRLRDYSESTPKPMVPIGYRPVLWHLMKYYAHFGHRDFILCLGWQADHIKRYFLNYDECVSNDFTLSGGGHSIKLHNRDIHDWNITFLDTGTRANIGQRLCAVRPYLQGEQTFLANYADGLSDLPLPDLIDFHRRSKAVASFMAVRPTQSFHRVVVGASGKVEDLEAVRRSNVWMNGGFFVLESSFFDYIEEGEELVEEPFKRLMAHSRLAAMQYDGFFACMDTFKEKQLLDDMEHNGNTPWKVWDRPAPASARAGPTAAPLTVSPVTVQPTSDA